MIVEVEVSLAEPDGQWACGPSLLWYEAAWCTCLDLTNLHLDDASMIHFLSLTTLCWDCNIWSLFAISGQCCLFSHISNFPPEPMVTVNWLQFSSLSIRHRREMLPHKTSSSLTAELFWLPSVVQQEHQQCKFLLDCYTHFYNIITALSRAETNSGTSQTQTAPTNKKSFSNPVCSFHEGKLLM